MKFLSFLLLIAACASHQNSNQPDSLSQSSMDTTKKITVAVKDTFTIELPVSLGTGFRWLLGDSLDKKLITLEDIRYTNPDDSHPGSQGLQTFVFKALNKGKTKIRVVHMQPWDKGSKDGERSYSISIR